jgi:hypothetical protein
MYRKLWLRGTFLLTILLLLSTILSACWPFPDTSSSLSSTTTQNNCPGNSIGPPSQDDVDNFVQSIKDIFHDDHIGAEARFVNGEQSSNSDGSDNCTQPTNLNLNRLQFVIHQVSDSPIQYNYNDTVINCTDQYQTYTGSLPVELVVGKWNNNRLQSQTYVDPNFAKATGYTPLPPTGLAVQDMIASTIYDDDNLSQYFGSESFTLPLPANSANSTVQVHLTLTVNVKAGWGALELNGKMGQVMDWFYNYGFQLPNNPEAQMTVTPCG